jgi:hypothetical protein
VHPRGRRHDGDISFPNRSRRADMAVAAASGGRLEAELVLDHLIEDVERETEETSSKVMNSIRKMRYWIVPACLRVDGGTRCLPFGAKRITGLGNLGGHSQT